jgi:hypothetical protein
MADVVQARKVVHEYLDSRKEILVTDPTITFKKMYAQQLIPMAIHENHEEQRLKISVGKIELTLLESLLEDSRSDSNAWQACNLIENDENTSYEIKYKIAKELGNEPKKRGVNPLQFYFRNFTIAVAVYRAITFGLPEYSKGNDTKETACLVVSEELAKLNIFLSSGAIEKIWLKYRDKYN